MNSERPDRRIEDMVRETEMDLVRLQAQMASIQKAIEELVTKAEFAPVKMVVYGLMTAVGASIVGALMGKVVIK